MRVLCQISLRVSADAQQEQRLVDASFTFDDSTLSTGGGLGTFVIPPNTTDFLIPLGGVTHAAFFFLLAQDAVSIKVGGTGAPAIPVRPVAANVDGEILSTFQQFDQAGPFLVHGRVDAVYVSNNSSTKSATIFVCAVGEAT